MKTRRGLANDAIDLVMPAIQKIIDDGVTGEKKHLHIEVWGRRQEGPHDRLAKRSIGNPEDWKYPFDRIARSKAGQAARSGQSNILVQALDPASITGGDTVYDGSF